VTSADTLTGITRKTSTTILRSLFILHRSVNYMKPDINVRFWKKRSHRFIEYISVAYLTAGEAGKAVTLVTEREYDLVSFFLSFYLRIPMVALYHSWSPVL
jgi:hypothetical protein